MRIYAPKSFNEITTPANPAAGFMKLYAKSGAFYQLTSAGVETALNGAGGSGAFSTTSNVTSNAPGTLGTDDFVFGSDSLNDDGDATHDARFFYDKGTYAFRAGQVQSTQWDNASLGNGSVAFGSNNTASGDLSFASGTTISVTASGAVAFGTNINSDAGYSLSTGALFRNNRQYSLAVGYGTSNTDLTGVAVRLEADSDSDNSKKPAIYIKQGTAPTTTTDKIHNVGGDLFFDGAPVASRTTIVTKTADYTATVADNIIIADGTSNTVTILLPTAVGLEGKMLTVKAINIDFAVDVDGDGTETIDGKLTYDFKAANDAITFISNNVNWLII